MIVQYDCMALVHVHPDLLRRIAIAGGERRIGPDPVEVQPHVRDDLGEKAQLRPGEFPRQVKRVQAILINDSAVITE